MLYLYADTRLLDTTQHFNHTVWHEKGRLVATVRVPGIEVAEKFEAKEEATMSTWMMISNKWVARFFMFCL